MIYLDLFRSGAFARGWYIAVLRCAGFAMYSIISNQKFSPARIGFLRSFFHRSSSVSVKGIPLPPKGILFMDSSPVVGLRHGISHVNKLAKLGVNVDTGTMLDVGCGWGRLAYGLLDLGFGGRYIGIDIIKSRIEWLNRNFSRTHPQYEFLFSNVRNDWYNPRGNKTRIDFRESLKPDTIILMSVFTHMYEDDIAAYLYDIRSIMSPKSVLAFSCFLFDGADENKATRSFSHKLSDHCRFDSPANPLSAIAYSETSIMDLLKSASLTGKIVRGSWAGTKTDDNFYQDMVIAHA